VLPRRDQTLAAEHSGRTRTRALRPPMSTCVQRGSRGERGR
jgi:hypothetical protein